MATDACVLKIGISGTECRQVNSWTTRCTTQDMPKSTVQKTSSEITDPDGSTRTITQYSTSVPKQLAEFFNLDQGDKLEWSMGSSRDKVELTVIRDEDGD